MWFFCETSCRKFSGAGGGGKVFVARIVPESRRKDAGKSGGGRQVASGGWLVTGAGAEGRAEVFAGRLAKPRLGVSDFQNFSVSAFSAAEGVERRETSVEPAALNSQPSTLNFPAGGARSGKRRAGHRVGPGGSTPAPGVAWRAPAPRGRQDACARWSGRGVRTRGRGDRAPRDRRDGRASPCAGALQNARVGARRTSGAPARRAYGSERPLVPRAR